MIGMGWDEKPKSYEWKQLKNEKVFPKELVRTEDKSGKIKNYDNLYQAFSVWKTRRLNKIYFTKAGFVFQLVRSEPDMYTTVWINQADENTLMKKEEKTVNEWLQIYSKLEKWQN